jgi:hypothetical protein
MLSILFLHKKLFSQLSAKDIIQVDGEFEIGSQYHFHLETQSVIVRPGKS